MPSVPNVLFVLTDDHAAHAIGAYGSVVNETPQLDRLAADGLLFDRCFCANALCAPSRASLLTGTYNHVNGVRTLSEQFDARQPTFVSALHDHGYQTGLVGKWHLGRGGIHDPVGFDRWDVLLGQGEYVDPTFASAEGERVVPGYVTDVITDLALAFLDGRDPDRPFCLLVNHKAPHRPWEPHPRHAGLYTDPVPLPPTWEDDYAGRGEAAAAATMRVRRDLDRTDLKQDPPPGLDEEERGRWAYQRYLADYLRCVAAVDESVGTLLGALENAGVLDDTIVVYSSDQGFFLGDHGWYDKRFMYEESLRMPMIIRYPPVIAAGGRTAAMISNVDLAPTLLDLAGLDVPAAMQGRSFAPVLADPGRESRDAVYYRYWEHDSEPHHVRAHCGIRTGSHKLIYYYNEGLGVPGSSERRWAPEWELFDLTRDPQELHSVHDDPAYAGVRDDLHHRLRAAQQDCDDEPAPGQLDG